MGATPANRESREDGRSGFALEQTHCGEKQAVASGRGKISSILGFVCSAPLHRFHRTYSPDRAGTGMTS